MPEEFGSPKEHLINSCKCNITSAYFGFDDVLSDADAKAKAEFITQECRSHSTRFSSVEKIVLENEARIRADPQIDRSIELICGYVGQSDFVKAMSLVEQKKLSGHPGYGLSFFAHAERFLSAQS